MVLPKTKSMGIEMRFTHYRAEAFYLKIRSQMKDLVKGKKGIIFVPCASSKPLQISMSHSYLKAITRVYSKEWLVLIVSEPLTLVPYFDCLEYPNYNYDPKELINWDNTDFTEPELEIFIERIQHCFDGINLNTLELHYIGGKHHANILGLSLPNVQMHQCSIIEYKSESEKLVQVLGYKGLKVKFSLGYIDPRSVVIHWNFLGEK